MKSVGEYKNFNRLIKEFGILGFETALKRYWFSFSFSQTFFILKKVKKFLRNKKMIVLTKNNCFFIFGPRGGYTIFPFWFVKLYFIK